MISRIGENGWPAWESVNFRIMACGGSATGAGGEESAVVFARRRPESTRSADGRCFLGVRDTLFSDRLRSFNGPYSLPFQ